MAGFRKSVPKLLGTGLGRVAGCFISAVKHKQGGHRNTQGGGKPFDRGGYLPLEPVAAAALFALIGLCCFSTAMGKKRSSTGLPKT